MGINHCNYKKLKYLIANSTVVSNMTAKMGLKFEVQLKCVIKITTSLLPPISV